MDSVSGVMKLALGAMVLLGVLAFANEFLPDVVEQATSILTTVKIK